MFPQLDQQEPVLLLAVALALGLVDVVDLEVLHRVLDTTDLLFQKLLGPVALATLGFGSLDASDVPLVVLNFFEAVPERFRVVLHFGGRLVPDLFSDGLEVVAAGHRSQQERRGKRWERRTVHRPHTP